MARFNKPKPPKPERPNQSLFTGPMAFWPTMSDETRRQIANGARPEIVKQLRATVGVRTEKEMTAALEVIQLVCELELEERRDG